MAAETVDCSTPPGSSRRSDLGAIKLSALRRWVASRSVSLTALGQTLRRADCTHWEITIWYALLMFTVDFGRKGKKNLYAYWTWTCTTQPGRLLVAVRVVEAAPPQAGALFGAGPHCGVVVIFVESSPIPDTAET